MYKYFTKQFLVNFPDNTEIDQWLNSFYDGKKPFSEYRIQVVGYVCSHGVITITVEEYSFPKK